MLLPAVVDDLEIQARVGAFLQGLAPLSWSIGRNVRIDAAVLAALAPDVILTVAPPFR